MPLGWDVKYNGVSISDKVERFEIVASRGSFVREMSLYIKDKTFYNNLDFSSIPESPEIEILTRTGTVWVSQGLFYIEKPLLTTSVMSETSDGIWGRSKTAVLGEPFATKITKTWDSDTTFYDLVDEVLEGTGITANIEIDDFTIYAYTYAVQQKYPIEIIAELARIAGAYVTTNKDNELVVRRVTFHPSSASITITDSDIINEINEKIELPPFGNRIKIGTTGTTGLSIDLIPLGTSDCLPPDPTVTGTLLALVRDVNGNPVNDGVVVEWEAKEGVTLETDYSTTGTYLLEDQIYKASNYYEVNVDFPIEEVIGVWAYHDAMHYENLYNPITDSFSGRTITFFSPLDYCDQTLRITYKTSGVAVNRVTPGEENRNVKVTASVQGASDSLIIKIGNPCECGSSIGMRFSPSGEICLGKGAVLLVWAEVNSLPATCPVRLRIREGCGTLSSQNKRFKTVAIKNEKATVRNSISGISQVECDITPADSPTPEVYLATDTSKSNNLYSSHSGKIIDLNSVLEDDTEVVIDYTAEGATAVTWIAPSEPSDSEPRGTGECEAIIEAFMEDGTEDGLKATIQIRAIDCREFATIPDENEESGDYDPDEFDNNWTQDSADGVDLGDLGDIEEGDSHTLEDLCGQTGAIKQRRVTGTEPESEMNRKRFVVQSEADCPPQCTCEELCDSEMKAYGNTQPHQKTITEELLAEGYTPGTPAFYEAKQQRIDQRMQECLEECEQTQQEVCGCTITGPDTATKPGTYQYSTNLESPVSWSVSGTGASIDENGLVTLDDTACGVFTVSAQSQVGEITCSKDVRVTNNGVWGPEITLCDKSDPCTPYSTRVTCYVGKYAYYVYWPTGYYDQILYRTKNWLCDPPCDPPDWPIQEPHAYCLTIGSAMKVVRSEWQC